jgi:signal transduction histidine kinase
MVETMDDTLEVTEPFEIYGDLSRLQHVLKNLFRNAVEHSDFASTVRVGPLGKLDFTSRTMGPGISKDERRDILEPGYTTESDGTGFG